MYRSLFKILRTYWSDYGGVGEFLSSPFLHVSLLFAFLYSQNFIDVNWRSVALQALPTILGFSIAAYTITFSLMGSALHRSLSSKIDKTRGISLIRIVNATFFHVVLIQISALMFALLSRGSLFPRIWNSLPLREGAAAIAGSLSARFGDIFGFVLTVYSIMLLLSVSLAMYRLGRMSPDHEAKKITSRAISANDDAIDTTNHQRSIIHTRRFKFIARLSKLLGLYN